MEGQKLSGTLLQSFGFAFRGLAEAWRSERNFRIQCAYTVSTLALLAWLRPDAALALLVLLGMTLLLAAELMNTALERTVDLACQGFHPLARAAKDLAASSVLVVAVATAVINLWVIGRLIAPGPMLGLGALLLGLGAVRFAPARIR